MNADKRHQTLLAIIIPYYSKYDMFFDECLSSVLNQSFSDYECLIVSTAEELNSLKQHSLISDRRCKCIISDKTDQSSKRNVGIEQSNSLYITFLDCDDYIDSNFFKNCSNLIKNFNNDLLIYNITRDNKKIGNYNNSVQVISDVNILRSFIFSKYMSTKTPTSLIVDSGCAKAFKADIIKKNQIRFIENMACAEDAVFVRRYCLFARTLCLCEQSYPYYWRINPFSTMNNLESTYYNLEPYCKEMKSIFQYLPEKYYDDFSRHLCSLFVKRIKTTIDFYFNGTITNKKATYYIRKNYSSIKNLKQVLNKRSFDEKPIYQVWVLIKHRLYFLLSIVLLISKLRHKH